MCSSRHYEPSSDTISRTAPSNDSLVHSVAGENDSIGQPKPWRTVAWQPPQTRLSCSLTPVTQNAGASSSGVNGAGLRVLFAMANTGSRATCPACDVAGRFTRAESDPTIFYRLHGLVDRASDQGLLRTWPQVHGLDAKTH